MREPLADRKPLPAGAVLTRTVFRASAPFAIFWVVAIIYQSLAGAYQDDFYYDDTAPHFVTGVMVADYLRTSFGRDPVAYAEQFYLRSPKVAFGRWPPLFHLLQGAVYFVCGASKATALVLVAAIPAAIAAQIFSRSSRLYGAGIALLAVLVFASFALVREHSLLVMSDLLTVLFSTMAAFAIADFLTNRRSRHLLLAATWTFLALLTKETAIHVLLFVPAAVAVVDGRKILRDWRYVAFAVALIALGGGFLVFRLHSGLGIHGYQNAGQLLSAMTHLDNSRKVFGSFFGVAPPVVFVLAACAVVAAVRRQASAEVNIHVRLWTTWLGAIVLFFLTSPAPPASRYFMPALIPLTMLVADLLHTMHSRMSSRVAAWVVPSVVTAAVIFTAPEMAWRGMRGYAPVARSISIAQDVVTLISSDAGGEGAFICERLIADRDQRGIVLRGSKVLASSDWRGTDYQLLKRTIAEMHAYLCDVPVHYIALDTHPGEFDATPDRELLQKTLEEFPQEFRPVERFRLAQGDVPFEDAVTVYENLNARGRRPESIQMEIRHARNRTLELQQIPHSIESPSR